jgi:hypothetical protein
MAITVPSALEQSETKLLIGATGPTPRVVSCST